ncbi:MAG: sugar ABC transporter permease [Gemmiger sp.]|nr:sugar ABC transporter permease [Gemmiger sp.]
MNLLRKGKSKFDSPRMGYIMLLPAALLLIVTQIYPFFYGVGMSFTDYSLLTANAPDFIGLGNYIKIFTSDPDFYKILGFSFVYTLSIVVFSYVVGMALALLLNRPIRGRAAFRAIVLIPWVISSSIMATNWKWLMNDQFGFINGLLQSMGLIDEPIRFFATAGWAQFSVTLIGIWRNIPFMAITLLSGLQSIPSDLYDASRVDGANKVQTFFRITLPSLRGVTLVSTTLMFIWAFNGFENIYLLTDGGPLNATMVVPIYAYKTAFNSSKMGYASALSVVLMAIMVIFSIIRMKLNERAEA